MKKPILIIVLLFFVAVCVACSSKPQADGERERASEGGEKAPVVDGEEEPERVLEAADVQEKPQACGEAERALWELRSTGWEARCLDAPLPRDTAVWASDGEQLLGLGPQGCTPKPEPLSLYQVEGTEVTRDATAQSSYVVTRSAGAAVDSDGRMHTYSAESCETMTNYGIHSQIQFNETLELAHVRPKSMWPVVFSRESKVLVSGGLELEEGKLDLNCGGGLAFEQLSFCWFLFPDKLQDYFTPQFCGRKRGEYVPAARKKGTWFNRLPVDGEEILPPGRELTWVYDPKNDRLVSLGFFEPNMWKSSEMDPTPLKWRVDEGAWAIPKAGAPYALPKPPVVGDGLTLLWHPELEQVILLDPFGEKSWLLSEEGEAAEWVVWLEHAPLAVPEGRELPANTQGLKHRYTQWWAPYFAYWDKEKGCPVVVFYDEPHSLCLPVEGLEETYACPKAHS